MDLCRVLLICAVLCAAPWYNTYAAHYKVCAELTQHILQHARHARKCAARQPFQRALAGGACASPAGGGPVRAVLCCGEAQRGVQEAECFRLAIEEMLYDAGADMIFAGVQQLHEAASRLLAPALGHSPRGLLHVLRSAWACCGWGTKWCSLACLEGCSRAGSAMTFMA